MQALIDKEGNIISSAPCIIMGVYDEPIEKWGLFDSEDEKTRNIMSYVIDFGYELVTDITIPSDYVDGKYFFENGEFVLNESWEPYRSPEQRTAELEEAVMLQEESLLASDEAIVALYEAQAAQEEINAAQDEAIIGLYELLG